MADALKYWKETPLKDHNEENENEWKSQLQNQIILYNAVENISDKASVVILLISFCYSLILNRYLRSLSSVVSPLLLLPLNFIFCPCGPPYSLYIFTFYFL